MLLLETRLLNQKHCDLKSILSSIIFRMKPTSPPSHQSSLACPPKFNTVSLPFCLPREPRACLREGGADVAARGRRRIFLTGQDRDDWLGRLTDRIRPRHLQTGMSSRLCHLPSTLCPPKSFTSFAPLPSALASTIPRIPRAATE